jgi:hypothetical protein
MLSSADQALFAFPDSCLPIPDKGSLQVDVRQTDEPLPTR